MLHETDPDMSHGGLARPSSYKHGAKIDFIWVAPTLYANISSDQNNPQP